MVRVLRNNVCLLGISLSLLLMMVGCGGGGGTTSTAPVPTVAVSITTPTTPQTVPVNGTLAITAAVTGTSNTAVTWTVNGVTNGNSTYGTIPAGSGLSVTYTAPTSVPSPAAFNITATSVADGTKSASVSVTVSGGVSVTMTAPTSPQSLSVNSTLGFTASVTGTSNTGVTWTVNGITNGNSTYGTITGSGLSVTYKAPAAVPSPATFNVTATSAQDGSKSASVSVTITVAAVGVSITSPSNPASIKVGGTLPITASVTGTANTAVTWTVTGANAGTVTNGNSTIGTIPGTSPSATYTAPASIPGGNNPVTITATSQADETQSASLTVTINPSTTTTNAVNVTGGASPATGINLSLPSNANVTLGLADVGTCGSPNPHNECFATVTGVQVSRSGLATDSCPNATCTVWLLGQGLTNPEGSALASGLTVSVTHGSTTDVTVSSVTAMVPQSLTEINFTITVLGTAPLGNRDLVVTLADGETQVYVGAIQIVD